MPKIALVTGGNGFIGSHLIEYLQSRGDTPIALVRKTSNLSNLEGVEVEYRYASLSSPSELEDAMAGVDIVYHVAGITAGFDRIGLDRVNTEGTEAVLIAAAAAKDGPDRVVIVSSLEASGPSNHEVARCEAHSPEAFTRYGLSKFGGEKKGWEAAQRGQDVVIVRPPLVYGPRDWDVLQMVQSANWRVVARPGFKDTWLSAIHPHDLVRGIVLAGEKGQSLPKGQKNHVLAGNAGYPSDQKVEDPQDPCARGIYYFDDGDQHTVVSFGLEAAKALGKKAIVLPMPYPLVWLAGWFNELVGRLKGAAPALNMDKARASVASGWWGDCTKARRELGYAPEMPLDEGLRQWVAYLKERSIL